MSEFIIVCAFFALLWGAEGICIGWEWLCRTVNPSSFTTTLDREIAAIYRELDNV